MTEYATHGGESDSATVSLARHLGVSVREARRMLLTGTAAAEIRKASWRGVTDPIRAWQLLWERR